MLLGQGRPNTVVNRADDATAQFADFAATVQGYNGITNDVTTDQTTAFAVTASMPNTFASKVRHRVACRKTRPQFTKNKSKFSTEQLLQTQQLPSVAEATAQQLAQDSSYVLRSPTPSPLIHLNMRDAVTQEDDFRQMISDWNRQAKRLKLLRRIFAAEYAYDMALKAYRRRKLKIILSIAYDEHMHRKKMLAALLAMEANIMTFNHDLLAHETAEKEFAYDCEQWQWQHNALFAEVLSQGHIYLPAKVQQTLQQSAYPEQIFLDDNVIATKDKRKQQQALPLYQRLVRDFNLHGDAKLLLPQQQCFTLLKRHVIAASVWAGLHMEQLSNSMGDNLKLLRTRLSHLLQVLEQQGKMVKQEYALLLTKKRQLHQRASQLQQQLQTAISNFSANVMDNAWWQVTTDITQQLGAMLRPQPQPQSQAVVFGPTNPFLIHPPRAHQVVPQSPANLVIKYNHHYHKQQDKQQRVDKAEQTRRRASTTTQQPQTLPPPVVLGPVCPPLPRHGCRMGNAPPAPPPLG